MQQDLRFRHIYREQNSIANWIATKGAQSNEQGMVWDVNGIGVHDRHLKWFEDRDINRKPNTKGAWKTTQASG